MISWLIIVWGLTLAAAATENGDGRAFSVGLLLTLLGAAGKSLGWLLEDAENENMDR